MVGATLCPLSLRSRLSPCLEEPGAIRPSPSSAARRVSAWRTPLVSRVSKPPPSPTFSVLFRVLDVQAFEQALSRWIASRLPAGAEKHISLDGKTARGSRDGDLPGQHLVAAYCAEAEAVLAQIKVDAKTNEHKAALQLLGILPVQGNIFTGDAMFCQRDVCATIIASGGDYVFTAKDNQPSLVIDIRAGLGYQEQAQRLTAPFSP